MRAIKIDVIKKQIYEIILPKGSMTLFEIYKNLECNYITALPFGKGHVLYIDDEGLLRPEPLGAFIILGIAQPLSGHGLILSTDEFGRDHSCQYTEEEIKEKVRFIPTQLLKSIPTQPQFIPLSDKEMKEYLNTGELPIGKNPFNLQ